MRELFTCVVIVPGKFWFDLVGNLQSLYCVAVGVARITAPACIVLQTTGAAS